MLKQSKIDAANHFEVEVRPLTFDVWANETDNDDFAWSGIDNSVVRKPEYQSAGPYKAQLKVQQTPFPVVVSRQPLITVVPEPLRQISSDARPGKFTANDEDLFLVPSDDEEIVGDLEKFPSDKTAQFSGTLVLPRSTKAPALLETPVTLREGLVELRTELVMAAEANRLSTILITGIQSGDGASFIAWHLSRLCAEYSRLRIALVVIEGQRSIVRRSRNRNNQPFSLLLRRTESQNLQELTSTCGNITLSELLAGTEAGIFLSQMKQNFDLILLDVPSVATHSETALLASQADGIILVAQRNVTPLHQLDLTHKRLSKANAKVLGVVFNRHH